MFFGIHNHTAAGSNLRLRDSINRVSELIDYYYELGHKGLVITEHESISSHLDALNYYKEMKDRCGDFKVALGNEIYLCPSYVTAENIGNNIYPHFILIALDELGHKGIRELSTLAWTKNAFMHVMYRVPTYYSDLEDMLKTYKGHIIGSSACLGSMIDRKLLEFRDTGNFKIIQECKQWINAMNTVFGKGYFFLELQPSYQSDQIFVNKYLIKLSKETNTPYIISTDAHYLKKEDRFIHKAYLNSQDGDREVDEFYEATYVMSEKEIHEYMNESLGEEAVQLGIDNTMLIYNKIKDYDLNKDLEIPYIPLKEILPNKILYNKYFRKIPLLKDFFYSDYPSDRHMITKMLEAIDKDVYYQSPEAYEKINECLSYILQSSEKNKVRWSAYLMQVADYIDIAWATGSLVGAGRGSGVGFCLLNILGITQINPLREKTATFPWRFLNPERASVLDIDIDIMSCMRDKVIQSMKDIYGEDRVCKVMTLSTETSKAAILTAARGLGIDNDIASYIASLVIFDRGQPRSLHTMYYGDTEHPASAEFKREIDKYPELWRVAQKIEGLVSNVGSHAGGVIIVDKPITESAALMRTKAGDVITQFDLHDCEKVSLIKIDLLCIDALDKIYETLMLLLEDNKITWQGTLKDTYEKYLGVYTLERDAEEMWKLLWNHKVISLFQMEKDSGKQALALTHPKSVDDLAVINSVIRLMAQEKGAEAPLSKFARFKSNIQLWYQEMDEAGLTKEEQKILEPVLKTSYGICESQEKFMQLVQLSECGGFNLSWADRLRKAVAKKSPKDYDVLTKEYFKATEEKGCSKNLCNYVWNTLIAMSRGYSFNSSHTLSYSIIGLQELNLCYKYNPIYWQTANLVVDSGSLDEESNDSTNYGKMGIAIANIQHENVNIALPTINEASFGFKPDADNNQIVFGLKGINGINTNVSQAIMENRPFYSFEDFCERMIDTGTIKNSQMIKLIKGGCFTKIDNKDIEKTMEKYLKKYVVTFCSKLTLAQLKRMEAMDVIPQKWQKDLTLISFRKYIKNSDAYELYIDPNKNKIPKRGYHDRKILLSDKATSFFKENFSEESIVDVINGQYVIFESLLVKEVDKKIIPFKEWMESNEALDQYNNALFKEAWNKYAEGTVEHWSMEALCYYNDKHELEDINEELYGVVNYFELPRQPEAYDYYNFYVNGEKKERPKYVISRIIGTVLNTDNPHHSVALLTKYGVVNVKFNKGRFAYYNKRISTKQQEEKKKTVLEESWFKRGNLIAVCGIRRDDQFYSMIYKDTVYKHTVNLIKEIKPDGTLLLQSERVKV